MQIHDLTLHNVGFKVSHNSYEIKPFDPGAQYDANVRGFELDISQYKTKSDFCVRHSPGCDSRSLPLSEYLKQIWEWHGTGDGEDPKDPMVIYIDLKSGEWSHDDFAQRFDDYVMECCPDPDRIFSPHQLMPGPADLMQGAMALGWPTLAELRGQLIFCLSGDNPGKRKYSETDPPQRLCFADHETIMPTCCDSGTRVFINVSRVAHFADFPVFSRWLRGHRALIGRAYDIATKTDWKIMQEAGFNMLAVDKRYAMDGDSPAHPYWPIPW